jgi:hypothetical protein
MSDIPDRRVLDSRLIIPDHVAFRVFPSKTIVVNLVSGTYHALNQTGGRILEALEEALDLRELAIALANELDQPTDRILDDLVGFVVELRQGGFIELERDIASHPSRSWSIRRNRSLSRESSVPVLLPHLTAPTFIEKLRLTMEILRTYVLTRRRLAGNDMEILNEVPYTRLERASVLSAEQTAAVAVRLGKAVAGTLVQVPTNARCLTLALVLLRLLSRRGIKACLVIGVHHENGPFAAHAWVEHRGIALLDPGGEYFTRLLEIETLQVV